MTTRTYHLCLSVRGALAGNVTLEGMFARDGVTLSVDEAREVLFDHLASGHEVIPLCPAAECPGFDYAGGGCRGHETL